ncbi:hypothetical protein CHS0354_000160 [Potamilus streckersoni]|uniref:Uncharacterized protein n=1 Tax=Potamilus streckersoni TaxID=2493646 RepID=A0AAE0TIG4_9BIVA|nr:hypothetical protein CHS0354_000160 [Potamilus streckersoni]
MVTLLSLFILRSKIRNDTGQTKRKEMEVIRFDNKNGSLTLVVVMHQYLKMVQDLLVKISRRLAHRQLHKCSTMHFQLQCASGKKMSLKPPAGTLRSFNNTFTYDCFELFNVVTNASGMAKIGAPKQKFQIQTLKITGRQTRVIAADGAMLYFQVKKSLVVIFEMLTKEGGRQWMIQMSMQNDKETENMAKRFCFSLYTKQKI